LLQPQLRAKRRDREWQGHSASKVDQVVKQVVAQGQQPDSPQLREMIKKDLIGREVLIQEADKQGYGTSPEVKRPSTMPVKASSSTPCWLTT
jgi:hypothetical protein